MAESQNLSIQLAKALRARDEARKHAAPEALDAADAEVARVKALVQERLDDMALELDGLRREQSAQEVRYKTGEYTEAQYRNATADGRRRVASLGRLEESFNALLAAETEADARRTSGRPAASGGRAMPSSKKEAPRPEVSQASRYIPGKRSLEGIPAPKWMLIGSGMLIAVGIVAVAVLLFQATVGSINLPSLFQRGGGTDVAPPSSATTTPPSAAPAAAEFQVPVQLRGAQGVGSLFLELGYDASAIEILRVDSAALPSGTLFEYGLGQGRVSIGAVSSAGLNGDWVVAFITCRRVTGAATSGVTSIIVVDVQAHRAADLSQAATTGLDGSVNLSSLAAEAPTIAFG